MSQSLIKIVIADDESWIRKGIIKALEGMNCSIDLVEAVDGEEAMAAIIKLQPDIVLLDICMPFIDGIQILQRINKLAPKPKVIVISGYSEFEYAQNAINYGAVGYLLKPLNTEQLYQMLKQAMDELNYENQTSHLLVEKREIENQYAHIHYEKSLNSIIHTPENWINRPIIQANILPFSGDSSFQFLIIHLDNGSSNTWNFTEENEIRTAVKQILSDRALEYQVTFYDNYNNVLELFALITDLNPRALAHKTEAFLKQAIREVKVKLQISVTIAVSIITKRIDHKLYERTKLALDLRFIQANKIIYRSEEVDKLIFTGMSDEQLNLMAQLIRNSDYEKIKLNLHNIFSKPTHQQNHVLHVRLAYADIMNVLIRTCMQLKLNTSDYLTENDLKGDVINYCNYSYEIESYLYTTITHILMVEPWEEAKNTNIIERVVRQIDENKGRTYTVKDMAYKYAINPNYFSTLFKKSKGLSFIEYVNNQKIEGACGLLAYASNINVTEIANSLGFSDTQYFFKLFKKIKGITPLEYKKSLLENR